MKENKHRLNVQRAFENTYFRRIDLYRRKWTTLELSLDISRGNEHYTVVCTVNDLLDDTSISPKYMIEVWPDDFAIIKVSKDSETTLQYSRKGWDNVLEWLDAERKRLINEQ